MTIFAQKIDREFILKYCKIISLFFIAVGVGSGEGKFLGVAALPALIAFALDKNRFSNFKNDNFNITMLLFLGFIAVWMLIAVYQDNLQESKHILRNFEKITPFLFIYIFLGKIDNFFKTAVLGMSAGLFLNDFVVIKHYITADSKYGWRIGNLFGNPNLAGSMMAFVLPVFAYFTYLYRKNRAMAALCAISTMGIIFALLVSGSRGAFMAILTDIILAGALYLNRKGYLKFNIFSVLGVLVLIGITLSLFSNLYSRPYDGERILLWTAAWHMFLDNPIIGVGSGHWGEVYRAAYISPLAKEPGLPHPHNIYLYLLSEVGIIGFVSYFMITAWQFYTCIKYSRIAVKAGQLITFSDIFIIATCGLYVHNLVDVVSILRDFMMTSFFLWAICCLKFDEIDNKY